MKLLSALKILQEGGSPIMQTDDVAYKLGVSNKHASQILRRLAQENHVIHLSRGLWVIDLQVNPLLLPDYLVAPFPCYISLQTALYHHGIIDQISRVITVVSLGRTRQIRTPLATVSVHHIGPDFFSDFLMDANSQVKMATPEKALLDILYLKPAKSLWFRKLPEVEIPDSFDVERAFEMIQKISSKSRRTFVEDSLRAILQKPPR